MARVTIGVPVFNGASYLRESLECLRTQTFDDFEVLIGDNASTDDTAQICAEFAAQDARFRHMRRAENIGVLGNFRDLSLQGSSPLFCWRAHDDLSAPDYLEKLVGLFDDDPRTRLAVGHVRTVMDDRDQPRMRPWRQPPTGPRVLRIAHQLRTCRASWIYGVWDRETLVDVHGQIDRAHPSGWGWDYLALVPLILEGRIAGTKETEFIQRIFRAATPLAERRLKQPPVADWPDIRRDYIAFCRGQVAGRAFSALERAALAPSFADFYDRTCISRWRVLRARLGLSGRS